MQNYFVDKWIENESTVEYNIVETNIQKIQ